MAANDDEQIGVLVPIQSARVIIEPAGLHTKMVGSDGEGPRFRTAGHDRFAPKDDGTRGGLGSEDGINRSLNAGEVGIPDAGQLAGGAEEVRNLDDALVGRRVDGDDLGVGQEKVQRRMRGGIEVDDLALAQNVEDGLPGAQQYEAAGGQPESRVGLVVPAEFVMDRIGNVAQGAQRDQLSTAILPRRGVSQG